MKMGKKSILRCFFIILISGFSALSFAGWADILPLLAGVFGVVASSLTSEKRPRQFSLFWCLFWLLNSTFKFYPVAFVNDLLCTVSTVISLISYRDKDDSDQSKDQSPN